MSRFEREHVELLDLQRFLVRDMVRHAESCPSWHEPVPHYEVCSGWADLTWDLHVLSVRTVRLFVREGMYPESELVS